MKLNKEYKEITNDILENEFFQSLKNDVHHGTNKYDHCRRVSHLSFLMAKTFNGNVNDVTRAGLLHDFFLGTRKSSEENSYLRHPFTSAKNAEMFFDISENEKNIIETHMYHNALLKNILPFTNDEEKEYFRNYRPKNKDGAIVCIADLLVSIFECFTFKFEYSFTLFVLFIINTLNC